MPPTEDFSSFAPLANDQSTSFLNELKILSERPSAPQVQSVQETQFLTGPSAAPEQRSSSLDGTAPVSAAALSEQVGAQEQHESKEKLDALPNSLLNLGIAAAAIWGAEAIGAVVFRSPKLAAMAFETAAGSTKAGIATAELAAGGAKLGAAAELSAASAKFGFLTGDTAQLYGKISIFAGTYGAGIAARHYSYEALTGQQESWMDSANQVGTGAIGLLAGRQIWKWSAAKL